MIIIVKGDVIYFPRYVVNRHSHTTGSPTARGYKNFAFFSLAESGALASEHYRYGNVYGPLQPTHGRQVGLYLSPNGTMTYLSTTASPCNEPSSTVDMLSTSELHPVDMLCEDGWVVFAVNQRFHYAASALMHLGVNPRDAISETLKFYGELGSDDIRRVSISGTVKALQETFEADPEWKDPSEAGPTSTLFKEHQLFLKELESEKVDVKK